MTLQYITLLCSVFIFAQVCSMPTNCHLQWRLVKTSHNLLENMGGLFPHECLDNVIQITFPISALKSKALNQKTVYKIMEHIDFLFANDTLPESWDQQKAEDFLNVVYRLTDESKCILKRRNWPAREDALNTYFNKLATLLRDKDHSVCAWEVIRKELLHVFKVILKLNPSKV